MTVTAPRPVLNIWIHGTFPQDFIAEKLHNIAPFKHIVNLYFCPPGLNKVVDLPTKYHYCQLARTAAETDPYMFPLESFYLFGWSGKLSPYDRDVEGALLYKEIQRLIKDKSSGQQPFIRIIAHSHGGNVALAMAKECTNQKPAFYVDELILLGTPVNKATAHCTKDPLFTQIFSVHSHIDMIQVLDPQGLPELTAVIKKILVDATLNDIKDLFSAFKHEPFFSARHFEPQENLKNVRLQFNGRDIFHMECIIPDFFVRLPIIIKALENEDNVPKMVLTSSGDWLLNIQIKQNQT